MFDLLVIYFLVITEHLCRKGIYKNYYEVDENIPYVKGKILFKENLARNPILKHKVYCNYSEFDPDNLENRIIKYTIYYLLATHLIRPELYRKTKLLMHYFDTVSFYPVDANSFPKLIYNRLTIHYEPIINICRLILTGCSINLGASGEIKFSSFLIDMNALFENFVVGILARGLRKGFVKGGKGKEHGFSDIELLTEMKPDIVVYNDFSKRLLVMDTKYKRDIDSADLNQIWIYSSVLELPLGILVYPKNESLSNHYRTHARSRTRALIKLIDLSKQGYIAFQTECSKFVYDIEKLLNEL
ncbi:MAG TPA: hypothetical protein VH796_04335 [Nitrososphaeraceae archaeon]